MDNNTLNYGRLRNAACFVDVALTVVSDNGKCLAWQTISTSALYAKFWAFRTRPPFG